MGSLKNRVSRLESKMPAQRSDGRDPDLIALCREVYGERFDESSVPLGMTVDKLLADIAASDSRPPVKY